jgi:hypothetical protein
MKKTYKDFNSREEFLQSLGHWHYDKSLAPVNEFQKIGCTNIDYKKELDEIKKQLETIKSSWNNQSIQTIRKEVSKTTQADFNLDVMIGQENDKLQAGYDVQKAMYHVKKVESDSVWEKIGNQFGLGNPLIRFHIQFPGDITIWHTDIFAPHHNLLPSDVALTEETVGQDLGLRRILIALEDWDWGQCFMFGAQTWSQWHAGDAIFWKFGTPHCAANMGFTPRISISVTGQETEQFKKIINESTNL